MQPFADDPAPNEISWKELLFGESNAIWIALVALGWLLFELTANESIVAVAVCTKLGLPDVLNAVWLRRGDPVRSRGKVVSWFCVSAGLWKTTFASLLILVLYVALTQMLNPGMRRPPAALATSLVTFAVGFVLASLTTWCGILLARVAGRSVWIDGKLADSRRERRFPPLQGTENQLRWLIVGSLILPGVCAMVGWAVIGNNMLGLFCGLFVMPVIILAAGYFLSRNVVAEAWSDCWGSNRLDDQPEPQSLS